MSNSPMLSINEIGQSKKTTANLLPCRIHHDGSIDPVSAYWKPTDGDDGSKHAYFRGRRLQGKTLALPDGYRGLVMERTTDELKKEAQLPGGGAGAEDNDEDDEVVALETVGVMQATGEFDQVVVWAHESTATASGDPYVRTIEEWLQVSEKIHGFDDVSADKTK